MFRNLDQVLWTVANTAPLMLAMLAAGLWLLANRRKAPRACVLAGCTLLGLVAFNGAEMVFRQCMLDEINATLLGQSPTTGLTYPTLDLIWRLNGVLVALVHAAAVVLVARAVLLERGTAAKSHGDGG
jgi:hypothetical protein